MKPRAVSTFPVYLEPCMSAAEVMRRYAEAEKTYQAALARARVEARRTLGLVAPRARVSA